MQARILNTTNKVNPTLANARKEFAMKQIAACLLGLSLMLAPIAATGEEDDPIDEGATSFTVHGDLHQHHSIFSLFRRHVDGERSCTHLLQVPFFSLYRSERYDDHRDLQILSLPIIGSLYRHRVDGTHHRREFLYLIDIES